jgi:hypothetical protein
LKKIVKLTPIFPWSTHQDLNVFTSILYCILTMFFLCILNKFPSSQCDYNFYLKKMSKVSISFSNGPINVAHHKNKNANFFMHPTTHQLNHSCKHESINLGKIVSLTPKCFSLKKRKGFCISLILKIHNLFLFPWSFQHIHIKIVVRCYHVPNRFPTSSPSFFCVLLDWTQNYWNQQNHSYDKRMCK